MALPLLAPVAARAQGAVSGTVNDARSGAPLPGATIVLDGMVVGATDAIGRFAVPAVPAGSHELRITFLGYEALARQVQGQAAAQQLTTALQPGGVLTGEALVTATRANERTATTYTTVTKEELEKRNFGQDLPYLLDQTPSVVVSSDAGTGIGYTGIRVRGTDIAGINVTINGVPLNDAESHGAFFVNLPDLASSASSIQVQRGVGTSQNGGSAFGASINIGTLDFRREAYGETQNTHGSYNTWKNNVSFGTGLIGGRFTLDGRLSRLRTDGYIDRAESDLKSYYFAAGYQQKGTSLKFITFSGREKTYQAWNGVPEDSLRTNRRHNDFTYDNQTDNYQQNHYQLHFSQDLGPDWSLGAALHLTRGLGYYEEYKTEEALADYGIAPLTLGGTVIENSDLIRRKWLDNYFYGATYALNYQPAQTDGRLSATLGGGWNRYDGDHYGEVIWARYAGTSEIRQRYYFNEARKTDFNVFLKATYQVMPRLGLFGDVQLRTIDYRIKGLDDDQRDVTTRAEYTFFNPKAGLTYTLSETQNVYASFAVGQREPVRTDFTDRPATDRAKAERLHDVEAGYRFRSIRSTETSPMWRAELTYFFMDYRNQLVATGQLNDVGTALRTNIPSSYRTGIELSAGAGWLQNRLTLSTTLTVSRNQLREFREVVAIYDENYTVVGTQETELRNSTISYSPAVVSGSSVEGEPLKGLRVAVLYKTVSRQFLDNSATDTRSIKPYQVADLRVRYTLRPAWVKEIELGLLVNNLFSREYVANGYTFGGIYQPGTDRQSFNYFYPQATRNFLASVGVKF
ncbi:TonB-dependent receptor [Hymenobacter elongatus]|uniref:TonB-dependent receptor n=1 Tax=Hymenobacter elongatus TaxID=877208 RepID=A0A4Z0PSX2_9BACT|nr:TonB-dependent receptor [Hymenobacter elongatus]